MNCPRIDGVRLRKVVEVVTLILVFVTAAASVFAEPPSQKTRDALRQAYDYQLQFRAGDLDVVPAYVAMLEEATQADSGSADLWYAMGVAYLAKGARAMMPGGNPADAMTALQKGPAALRRALEINPDHARALAQLGGVQALMGSFMQMPAMAAKGVVAMNRAVELDPKSTRVRLQRAFSGLNLPEALRNNAAEGEDLDFLSDVAGQSRPGDYVRLMRADLYFETGKPDQARMLYERVEKSGSPAAADAKSRLAALDQGVVAMSDIKALRAAAGAKCAMCHGG